MRERETSYRWVVTASAAIGTICSIAAALFSIRGDFLLGTGPTLGALITAIALVLAAISMGAIYFSLARKASLALALSQAAAWTLMARVALDLTGGHNSPFYSLVYMLAAIAGAYVPLGYVAAGVIVFISTEAIQAYFIDAYPSYIFPLLAHLAGLACTAAVIGVFFRAERKRYHGVEEELNVYRRGQAEFGHNADEFKSIREEGRREQLRESIVNLQDELHRILGDLYDILKPHTCILFTRDPRDGRLYFRDALSDGGELNRSAEIGEGEGLLGWVIREREALRLTSFQHPPENLVYYRSPLKILSVLAVPVIRSSTGIVEGILVVDSLQEGYFTKEDERLIWLAARQVVKELETAEQRRRELIEARISHALYRVSEVLNSSLDLNEVFDALMACIEKILDADVVALALYNSSSGVSKIVRAVGEDSDSIIGKTFTPNESLVGWVTTPEQYLYYSDFGARRIQKPVFGKNFPSQKNIGTFFCYPLVSGGDFLGSLTIIFEREGAMNDYERNAVTTTARMAATSIANADLHQRVAQMATTDGLTGLYNHRYFQERLTERIEEAKRHPTRHALVLVDIDHFKKVNDTYGHPVGDKVLKSISKLLRDTVRNVDLAARYGGEEFVLILTNTKREGAENLSERIRIQASKLKFESEGHSFRITISMGIAVFPEDGRNKKHIIEHADQALYYAKENGRNRVVCYSDIKAEGSNSSMLAPDLKPS